MAFYLKKTKLKGRTYLSIDESFYSHEKKGTAHKCYKSLGSVETLKQNGMDDPISFYQNEVDKLNAEKKLKSVRKIDKSPVRHLGYFPFKSILNKLHIKNFIDLFKYSTNYEFDLYEVLSSLIYARAVNPCSKYKTFHDVIPFLFEEYDFSYDQLLEGLCFYGNNYEKIVELFTAQTKKIYNLNTSTSYFDCTNFYFEIDREDDFRRKGPSKENRHDPIVGLGLLLDKNQIPIGMKLYPGNESEKPVLRNVIDSLKSKNNITGKTIQVADKGLNCSENILAAIKNGNGYLFSKSVKSLPEKEKAWVLLKNDWENVLDKNKKVIYRYKSCVDEFPYTYVDANGKKKTIQIKEKRLLTFNPSLAKKKLYEINKMIEKAKTLTAAKAKKSEYGECGKYVHFVSIDSNGEISNDNIRAVINNEQIEKDKQFAGYNLLVTSECKMKDEDIYNTYHNLWRIEESFKIMKSDLDARPVFLQKENAIKGHFLICYLTILIERIFQFKILNQAYSSSEILNFIKEFKVVKAESKYINITSGSNFIFDLAEKSNLPLTNYMLTETQLKKVLNHIF